MSGNYNDVQEQYDVTVAAMKAAQAAAKHLREVEQSSDDSTKEQYLQALEAANSAFDKFYAERTELERITAIYSQALNDSYFWSPYGTGLVERVNGLPSARSIQSPQWQLELLDISTDSYEGSDSNAPSFASGYYHYLTNPGEMDTDLEVGFYVAAGTAGVAGAAAGGLAIAGAAGVSSVGSLSVGALTSSAYTTVSGVSASTVGTYVGTQGAFAAAETAIETGINYSLDPSKVTATNIVSSFGKNFAINTATGGIATKGKWGMQILTWGTRQAIEISGETAYDVGYNGNDLATSLAINTVGSVAGEGASVAIGAGIKRAWNSSAGQYTRMYVGVFAEEFQDASRRTVTLGSNGANVVAQISDAVKATNKRLKDAPISENKLEPGELIVGRFGDLSPGVPGDNLTPHHGPSSKYIRDKFGISRDDGYAIMLQHFYPSNTGRHARTRTFGNRNKAPELMEEQFRTALGRDVRDVRRILQEDGVYSPQARQSLKDWIALWRNDDRVQDALKVVRPINEL
ncbi:hypothetical protein LOC68_25280 [Blastopirellula sp. JC732]|uniref:Uncharacterized protein n=1 Tax=Blastopirellula sediminis TaxID=2894196 RepID=A0A9X1SIK6_9BACT|nr:hypothetical protein [Blastopirellula sediminis]MCC9604977.1 hypothetical protein [Blastopirellula sediminis]MCC9631723.1 hypothetical protein [Blastopirellula sediminis]